MDPYMDAIDVELADFMPGFSNLMTYKGSAYLLPQDSNVIMIYMNNRMFEEAGWILRWTIPKPSKIWMSWQKN